MSHTSGNPKGSADDGKRFLSVGRCIGKVIAKPRGEFEGGGLEIGLRGRLADSHLVFFSVSFSSVFSEGVR